MNGKIQVLRVQECPGVDADDLAIFVDQGAAGVAAGDGGVMLHVRNTVNHSVGVGDHAVGEGGGQTLGVAEGVDNLAYSMVTGAQLYRLQAGSVDLQNGNVNGLVVCQHVLNIVGGGTEGDLCGVAILNDVVIGDDFAVGGVDEASAQRIFVSVLVVGDDFAYGVQVVIIDFRCGIAGVGEFFGVGVIANTAGVGGDAVRGAGRGLGYFAHIAMRADSDNGLGFDGFVANGADLMLGAVCGAGGFRVGDPFTGSVAGSGDCVGCECFIADGADLMLGAVCGAGGFRVGDPFTDSVVDSDNDLGFDGFDTSKIAELCASLDIPYTVVKTDIGQIIFGERKEKNPCSLCAKMRKGALNDAIKAIGCNKVAYAHHKDDVVETMIMSLIYEGRFHTFAPVTYLDRMEITVIRPLIYMTEAEVIGFVNKNNVPVVKSPCPADGYTKREYVKELLRDINKETPGNIIQTQFAFV